MTDRLPEAFADLTSAVIALGDPVASGVIVAATWKPGRTSWEFEPNGGQW